MATQNHSLVVTRCDNLRTYDLFIGVTRAASAAPEQARRKNGKIIGRRARVSPRFRPRCRLHILRFIRLTGFRVIDTGHVRPATCNSYRADSSRASSELAERCLNNLPRLLINFNSTAERETVRGGRFLVALSAKARELAYTRGGG